MSISSKRLKQINLIKEKEIDYSDIPELDKNFWDNVKPVYPNEKKAISIRLDHDIIDFFKKEGRGYQSKINNVLRSYIEAHH
ncbi:MAG: 3-oxoacyl-ACP synthase [Spirochaetes bacterium]|nr:MAG: 3-oxoacyl-ACP synthase [Spirochaetota bacterium]